MVYERYKALKKQAVLIGEKKKKSTSRKKKKSMYNMMK